MEKQSGKSSFIVKKFKASRNMGRNSKKCEFDIFEVKIRKPRKVQKANEEMVKNQGIKKLKK